METRLGDLLKNAAKLNDVEAWFDAIDNETIKQIIQWIQVDQLTEQGIDENGNVIGTYSYITEWITKGRKQEGDHYTLNDTGEFYRSMLVKVLTEMFIIDANDNKGDENLFEKYGPGIVGLTDENMQKLRAIVAEKNAEYIRQTLGIA